MACYFKKYSFVLYFKILSQYDASIVFLLGFGMVMQHLCKFQKNVIEPKWFLGYLERGNACALTIPIHE